MPIKFLNDFGGPCCEVMSTRTTGVAGDCVGKCSRSTEVPRSRASIRVPGIDKLPHVRASPDIVNLSCKRLEALTLSSDRSLGSPCVRRRRSFSLLLPMSTAVAFVGGRAVPTRSGVPGTSAWGPPEAVREVRGCPTSWASMAHLDLGSPSSVIEEYPFYSAALDRVRAPPLAVVTRCDAR